ncbi:putative ABC transport system permease protein [Dysgonomonas sp. PFB1-18]|uniref:ABC transporter permease n=1 Tax=unclassified Dysgonomonas TaxID=2630389 RepID=UPI002476170D|nr:MULTISPECIES: FtsX-like permease family protein [unclassified Dysgonomonas]MDH6309368.1 putative ABC transport system permease protein [Dysgonomonas sp. PF1-14]MDH6339767.1 putative ABC transport system permease protein [Dysgonomonas sp. PF1-16]MDH6381415.1 putative ABC transport system permease protein [Dysgonomonas sp. PFB1-18]MDH6398630.1 putative ABC transport system permease protein [Dysgonomonas sp. PF1-23]
MGLFIKLAIRNVSRNIKSTLLNGLGITLSVFVLLLVLSVSQGIESQIVSRNIKFETGALSIAIDKKTASYENESQGNELLVNIYTTLDNNNFIVSYFPRIYISNSNIYFNDNSQAIQIVGMTEEELPLIGEMLEIVEGETDIVNSKGIIVSNAIANTLEVKTGDFCNLMVQTIDGSINLDEFMIKGIFHYTSQLNKFSVYANYSDAEFLYNCNLPSKIFINVNSLDKVKEIKVDLLNQLGCQNFEIDNEVEYNGIKISSYLDHLGMAKALSTFNRYGMLSIVFFLILISFIGIWSMQTENINERYREIGSLLSFGFKKKSVKQIFLYESIYISCIFFFLGLIIVLLAVFLIKLNKGIYLGESASFAFGSTIVNPELTFKHIYIVFTVAVIYPLLATILSLLTINKKKIIELLNN